VSALIERLIRAGDAAMPEDCDVYYDAVDRLREMEQCLRRIREKHRSGEGAFSVIEYITAVLERDADD